MKITKKNQQEQEILQNTQYFQRQPKKYKKVVYQEESDSELEVEEDQYISEEKPIKQDIEQKQPAKRKDNLFENLNKDAKRGKQ